MLPGIARWPKTDDFSCRNPRRREAGHGPLIPTPGQGELCPPRDAQAESSGKDSQFFQILMERLSAAFLQAVKCQELSPGK